MNLTVEEALTIHPFSKARLVAGKKGTARLINSVNIMDAPDIYKWTKYGEMVFTTAYIMKDNPLQAVKILQELNNKGCSGLGIKLGRYWKEIPSIVVEEAEKLQFPLLELPYEFTFSDQIRALFNAEYNKQKAWLESTTDSKTLSSSSGLSHNIEYFSLVNTIVHYPIAILSNEGQVLFNTSDWTEIELLEDWILDEHFEKTASSKGVCYPIQLNEGEHLYMLVVISPDYQITSEEDTLFTKTANMLSNQLQTSSDLNSESLSDYRSSIVIEKYLEDKMSIDDVTDYLTESELTVLSGSYICTLLNSTDPSLLQSMKEKLSTHPKVRTFTAKHYVLLGGIFSIYSHSDGDKDTSPDINHLANSLSDFLSDTGLEQKMTIYISNSKKQAVSLFEGYSECVETKSIAEQYNFDDPISTYDNLEFISLLRHIPIEYMEKYYNGLLHPLLTKESQYGQEMLHTLETYIKHNGQVNETAKKLFVHRNTVLYRLEKIGELIDVDTKKTNDMLRLKLAFLFKQLKNCG
ncbi:transcriptional regulator [Halalkalibacter wakoensis JCM 9140]|uniref:Transcriptional regulator n=1 Tax=Halalkalibacter wakoensis JCM 9140 TaxID=1236970 RepID=W4Q8S9_9BACI|nr:PucR family transcriptional regulator [Halalkalibacter wakoensis]GAE28088.1 transcriptional regulator [Halalkalibacter wakoensis JCM 9140]